MSEAWEELTGGLTGPETDQLLAALRSCDAKAAWTHFPLWAHPGQVIDPADPRAGTWRTWVIMAGRGFGKTLAGAQWVTEQVAQASARGAEPLAIALAGATIEDARRVMVEGRSGLLNVAAGWIADWRPSLNQLHFTTGAVATLFSGASPDRLRGPEHHLAWCDELAKWEKAAASWDMLQLGLRLGERPRALVTTTPRGGPLLRAILADPDTVQTGGPTGANPHLPPAFKTRVHALYAGTRLGAQELNGVLLTDSPGALWTVELLERCRRANPPRNGEGDRPPQADGGGGPPLHHSAAREVGPLRQSLARLPPPRPEEDLVRICIGVDPPVADGTCGIIACALDEAGIAHVLADHSVTARSPEGWARAVADAARIHAAPQPSPLTGSTPPLALSGGQGCGLDGDSCATAHERGEGAQQATLERSEAFSIPTLIIAETNQGGRMVKTILHTADPTLHVKPVTARMSKADRAAPIAHLFEAGKVILHARFPELEAQLCGLIAGGEYEGPGGSPDRADAMVWALTELMLGERIVRVRGF